ncbi:hypothetical protein [Sphingomonas sp. 3-13AW]|uniref:hypothetical protein n=1 Tax=Sphingomonas sp. 3-13AW TaxID=3050450 RepID=UPI003BB5A18C
MHPVHKTAAASQSLFIPRDHWIDIQRVDGTGDVERFMDPARMRARFSSIVANEPEIVFVTAVQDLRPIARFRRDAHPSLRALSEERQRRALYLCSGAQARHERRYGEVALRDDPDIAMAQMPWWRVLSRRLTCKARGFAESWRQARPSAI